jgi:phytanoyl-CoA dioxygenase PhyH
VSVELTTLSTVQRDEFAQNGYIVLPGVVDDLHVDTALHVINHWLFMGFDSTQRFTYYAKSYAPEHESDPEILGLLTDTGGFDRAVELVGRPLGLPTRGQIALRFPVPLGRPAYYEGAHVDGTPTSMNGVPHDGRIHGHTLLAGVLLSDVPAPDQGNFTVWPGSHLTMARWFAEHGTKIPDPEAFFRATEATAAATSEPVAVVGRAGDLILAHHLLAHANGGHTGPRIRYAVFFRLSTDVRAQLGDAVLTDPWAEWDAMQPFVRGGS